jgi:predicted nucleic acid-binding protein
MAMAWFIDEDHVDAVQSVLDLVTAEGAVVPSLWRLEVANSLHNSVRRKRIDKFFADECLVLLGRLNIVIDSETDEHAWSETRLLAIKHGLTVYDAAYLELAIRRQLPLASCDGDLIKAAKKAGVGVVG